MVNVGPWYSLRTFTVVVLFQLIDLQLYNHVDMTVRAFSKSRVCALVVSHYAVGAHALGCKVSKWWYSVTECRAHGFENVLGP